MCDAPADRSLVAHLNVADLGGVQVAYDALALYVAARLHEVVFVVAWSEGERARQVELVTLLPEHTRTSIPGARR